MSTAKPKHTQFLVPIPDFRPIPPPPGARTDRFGLPTNWTLMDFDKADREAAVAELVHAVFETAVRQLGQKRARALFAQKAAGRPGRRPNDGLPTAALNLLAIYDARAGALSGRQLRALPRQIALEHSGHSAEAAEKMLRRALQQRDAAHAKAERRRIAEAKRREEYRRAGGSLLDRDLLGD